MHLIDSDDCHTPPRLPAPLRPARAWPAAALPLALNLAAMGEAAAFNATDYKALVCVFLYGGNDYANTVVTYDDPSYDAVQHDPRRRRGRRPRAASRWRKADLARHAAASRPRRWPTAASTRCTRP